MKTLKEFLIENMIEKHSSSFNSDDIDDTTYLKDVSTYNNPTKNIIDWKVLFTFLDITIMEINKKCNHFKIGKSGSIVNRMSQYKNPEGDEPAYTKMYLILSSNNSEIINSIEAQCNTRYINYKKNDNTNEGSAGTCGSHDDKYYLYIVTR